MTMTQWAKKIARIALILLLSGCAGPSVVDPLAERHVQWQEQVNKGDKALQNKDFQTAIEAYQAALKIKPAERGTQLKIAEIYFQQGEYENARDAFAAFLKLEPRNVNALNYLGYIYEDKLKDYQAAAQQYEQVLEISPRNLYALVHLGLVYTQLHRLNEAEQVFQQALAIDPQVTRSESKSLHNYLGLVYEERGEIDRAIAELELSIRLFPNDAWARKRLDVLLDTVDISTVDTDQAFNDSELQAGTAKSLIVRSDVPPCTKERVEIAELHVLLNLGEDYNYGRNTFSTSVRLQIEGFDTIGNRHYGPKDAELEINEQTPEKLRIFNIPVFAFDPNQPDITDHKNARFDIEILGYSGDGNVSNDVNLEVFYTEKLAVDARHISEPSQPIVSLEPILSPTNPQTFRWQTECPNIPNYQFQLLRLYNKDASKTAVTDITAVVDWSQALTLETGSSETSLTLTIAEGTGFYIWRVRPIGNYYEGGIANDANWGLWSDTPTDGDIPLNALGGPLPAYAFFYNQFDDDKNWIYTRTFTEDNKIAEQITYANGLLQVKQDQKRLQSNDIVLVNQTVYDYSGRPALSSLTAPVTSNALNYIDQFLQHNGELYSAAHFDADNRYRDPAAMQAGPLHDYYSDLNPDLTIPIAQGYPFLQTLYYGDGTDRVKEQSGVGETHRIKPDLAESRTVKKYHSGVSDAELIRMFGDEAPDDTSVSKIITLDPNKTTSVVYINAKGDTIATCLSVNGGDANLLDALPSRASAAQDIVEDIEGDTPCGDGCLESSETKTFTEEIVVTLEYTITPGNVEGPCPDSLDSCQSCDYEVYFTIQRLDEPDPDFPVGWSLVVEPGACDAETWTWSESYTLPPGSYQISRRIQGRTQSDTPGNTHLDDRIDALKSTLESDISSVINPIYAFLDDSNLEGLYAHLGVQDDDDEPITIDAGCCEIDIPIIRCEDLTCPEDMDFERFFDEYWADEPDYIGTDTSGNLKYLPGYSPGEFNALISNMLDDPNLTEPYDCDALW